MENTLPPLSGRCTYAISDRSQAAELLGTFVFSERREETAKETVQQMSDVPPAENGAGIEGLHVSDDSLQLTLEGGPVGDMPEGVLPAAGKSVAPMTPEEIIARESHRERPPVACSC